MVPNETNLQRKQLKYDLDYYITSKSVNETKFVIFLSTYIILTILAGNYKTFNSISIVDMGINYSRNPSETFKDVMRLQRPSVFFYFFRF